MIDEELIPDLVIAPKAPVSRGISKVQTETTVRTGMVQNLTGLSAPGIYASTDAPGFEFHSMGNNKVTARAICGETLDVDEIVVPRGAVMKPRPSATPFEHSRTCSAPKNGYVYKKKSGSAAARKRPAARKQPVPVRKPAGTQKKKPTTFRQLKKKRRGLFGGRTL